jgi:hypothetical protein
MSEDSTFAWGALLLLGAYHGVNPGMGWLFAVALGMQEKNRRAVIGSLLPLGLGHGLSIGAVVALAALAQVVVPIGALKITSAAILIGFGLYCLVRRKHPRWGGMQVDFKDLTIWSFVMASAHGAGFMVLPVVLAMPAGGGHAAHGHLGALHAGMLPGGGGLIPLLATVLHTLAYLAVAGLIAIVVYEKLGLSLLRKAWINLDLIWAITLIATGTFVLFL